jgi:hypothetical protein
VGAFGRKAGFYELRAMSVELRGRTGNDKRPSRSLCEDDDKRDKGKGKRF